VIIDISSGAGEASADVPGGGESDDVAEETRKRVENAKINGEVDDLDGEYVNRLLYVSYLIVCLFKFIAHFIRNLYQYIQQML
jgi:hypothetical protein